MPCSPSPTCAPSCESLLMSYVAGFQPNPDALGDKLAALDPADGGGIADLQQVLGDPEVLLGAIAVAGAARAAAAARRPGGRPSSATSTTPWTWPPAASSATAPRIAEAVRRRRVEADAVRRLRRAAPRPHPHAGGGGAGPRVRGRRAGARRATWGGCGSRRPSCRRRPRWTPPASGWPASTSDAGVTSTLLHDPLCVAAVPAARVGGTVTAGAVAAVGSGRAGGRCWRRARRRLQLPPRPPRQPVGQLAPLAQVPRPGHVGHHGEGRRSRPRWRSPATPGWG